MLASKLLLVGLTKRATATPQKVSGFSTKPQVGVVAALILDGYDGFPGRLASRITIEVSRGRFGNQATIMRKAQWSLLCVFDGS